MRTILALVLAAVFLYSASATGEEILKKETIIGIDLGTAFTSVGVVKNERVEVITNRTASLWPFKSIVTENKPNNEVDTGMGMREFATEEISAMVLVKIREMAEAHLGEDVNGAVISFPTQYYNNVDRDAIRDAATIAGLNIVRVISEPVVAAIAYGLDKKKGERNVLVLHLGRGILDASLLTIESGVIEVLATSGHGEDSVLSATMESIEKVLKDADLKKEDVNEIILVGRSTHIPKLQQLIKEMFNGKEPLDSINHEEVVAYGAAVLAARISEEGSLKT